MSNALRRLLRRFVRQQRGSLAVETALALPILLAAGALVADIVTVSLEREHLEQRAGGISSVLGMQRSLTTQGLTGLLDATLPDDGEGGEYELLISNVLQNGIVSWQLVRGTSENLCNDRRAVAGQRWPDQLPEVDADYGKETISLLVVELCRPGKDLKLLGGLSLDNLMTAMAVNRVANGKIALDATLAAEAGVEAEDE